MKIQSSIFNLFIPIAKPTKDELMKKTESLEIFTALELTGGAEIHLHNGSSESKVTIEAEKDILPLIHTSVSGGILKVVANHKRKDGRGIDTPFRLQVYTSNIDTLRITGHAEIKADRPLEGSSVEIKTEGHITAKIQVKAQLLNTKISGAGNLTLEGTSDRHQLVLEGAVRLGAYGLKTETTDASLGGPCKADIYASEAVKLSANGLAKIRVKGSPKIVEKESQLSFIEIQ